jgi:transposase
MDSLLSLSPVRDHQPGHQWATPTRAKIWVLRHQGKSYGEINKLTGVARSTIQKIVKSNSSRTLHKGNATKKRLITGRELRQILRYISSCWSNRRQSWTQIKAALGLQASTSCIRRTLKAAGFRRCIACPRPFINKKQAKKRKGLAYHYRWWSVEQWKQVLWTDEATFETGKRNRIWVTRRPDEKHCQNCIRSVYRSGRVSVMIWGAIGWDYKSPLVFLEKEPEARGITSKAYLHQVLEPVVFPYFDSLSTRQKKNFIFMEDGAKVHLGDARLPRLNKGIRNLDWPPLSPDLNPIEKVWRWMKHELSKLSSPPLTIEDMKTELQRLWDQIKPEEWRYLTHRLTCKLEDVIANKGMATIH